MLKNKLKATFRTRALALLARGLNEDEIVSVISNRYHKGADPAEVRLSYFPRFGLYRISHLQGATRDEILKKFSHMRDARERAKKLNTDPTISAKKAAATSARMRALNRDPAFTQRRLEGIRNSSLNSSASRERMYELHADLVFMERKSARSRACMKRLQADPHFQKKRIEGIRRFWESYRAGQPVFAIVPDAHMPISPDSIEDLLILRSTLAGAFAKLTPLQRQLLKEEFDVGPIGESGSPAISDAAREAELANAFRVLRENAALCDVADDYFKQ